MTPAPSSLQSFIVGLERQPASAAETPVDDIAPDPAQALLEQLVADNLVGKAAFPLRNAELPAPSTPAVGRTCNEKSAKDLSAILSGRYGSLLPEFLQLLEQSGMTIPPEYLPEMLERALRDPALAEYLLPASGTRGAWLAQQNPHWRELLASEETDWFTANYQARKQLLRQTRARNPLLALAWVEKTWPEDKAEHRLQWLDILRNRLSVADEDLLKKAMSDKSRDLRRLATELAATLPRSEMAEAACALFTERFAGMFAPEVAPFDYLNKTLPDLSEPALQTWVALLSKEQLKDWRSGLLQLMLHLVPSADLPRLCACSPVAILEKLESPANLAALPGGVALHRDSSWVAPLMAFFAGKNGRGLWQPASMTAFLAHFAPEALAQMRHEGIAISYDNQVVLRALEQWRRPWSASLLDHFLEQYRAAAYGRSEIPGWHFVSALHVAAAYCSPSDAMEMPFVRDYLYDPPKARPREMEDFLGIIRFRIAMRAHLQGP